MKKWIISFLVGFAIGTIANCLAEPVCVTNVILSSLQPGEFTIVGAPDILIHNNGVVEGAGLIGVDCDLGPVVTLPIEYSAKPSRAAVVSWECTPVCGDGGAFVVRVPAGAASVSFRIFVSGQCLLTYCIVSVTYYPDVVLPNRFWPWVRE